MMNVITSEFYKVLRSNIFYAVTFLLTAMSLISFTASIVVAKLNYFNAEVKDQMRTTGIAGFQESYGGDLIFYIILIFIIFMITSEYSNGSIRQMASHGIARWKLVLGQYIALSSIITLILLSFGLLNLVFNTILFQMGDVDMMAFIRMNLGNICMFWGVAGIGVFCSYLFKNVGITIIVSVILLIGGKFTAGTVSSFTNNNVFLRYSLSNMRNTIIDFASRPEDIVKYSIVFILTAFITVVAAALFFTQRDID